MANTESNPFAYNPAVSADLFGIQPAAPAQALPEEDISQYMPQAQPQPQQGPASSYGEAFLKAEGQYGLPEGLLSTIGYHESRYNPNAVSPAGATGLMQLMPPTAKEYGVDARDPYASIDAAGKKMAGLIKYYNGDMAKAVAAYNYGEGNLNKAIRKAGDNWLSATPRETQLYVSNVLGGAPPPEQEGPKGEMYEIPLANGGSLHAPVGMPREQAIADARAHGIDAVGLREVPLANGGTLRVPDNMSDEEAVKRASEADPTIDFSLLKKEGDSRTFKGGLEDIKTTALKGGTAALQGFIGLADIITPGDLGAVIQNNVIDLSKYQDYLDKQFTPQQQQAIKNLNEAHGLGNILQAAIDNPSAVLSMLGQAAPQMVGGAGIAKAGLMGLGKVLTKVPAVAPYFATGLGEMGMGAGAQKENLRVTNPEGEATGANTEAALMTGLGTGVVGAAGAKLTTALGGIDPNLLLSGNARKMALQEFGDVANTPGFFRSTIVSMIGEGVFQEAPQSAIEQMSQNYATDRPLFEGVEDESVKGALMGALMGGGANTASQLVGTTEQAPPPPPPPVNPPAGEIPVPPQGEVPAPPVDPLIITPEERARVAEAAAGGPPVVAGAPVVAVKEPILRGKKEKPAKPVKTEPTWVTDMLGLHKKSGVYKKIATQGLDINNPADHEAIRKITDPVIKGLKKAGTITEEQSKILPNYMETVQQGQTTPIIEGATDAQQIPSTSPINGDGSTQSQESQAAEDITQAGEGMESGGQGIEAVETSAQEEVAPAVSSVMVKAADSVLQEYKEKPIPRNIGRLRTIAENLELPVTVDTPHAEVYDLVAKAIAPTQDMGRGIQINANEQGIDSVINKAAKQDEVVDEGLQARWIQHAKEGTLHKAEDDVTDFHYDLKTSNPDAHAKAEQANTQAIKAVEDTKTIAAEERIAEEGRLEREAKAVNLETIKKAVEAKAATPFSTEKVDEAVVEKPYVDAVKIEMYDKAIDKADEISLGDKKSSAKPLILKLIDQGLLTKEHLVNYENIYKDKDMGLEDIMSEVRADLEMGRETAASTPIDQPTKLLGLGEAKQTEGVTTTPITEAAITDIIQEANLNPEDDNYLSEQGDDFSGHDYPSVAPTSETTGHTAASLSKTLSPEMKRLVASGKAVIHDTAETLPEGKHPENVQGLTTAEGVTHYVANKLTPETLESVALHEVGTHVGMENLVGSKVYKDIANQALNNVGEVFDKARASIPKDTPTHLRHHEALAYLVENAPNLPVVKKIVSAVRNFARMHLGMKLQLTEADARHLAVKALRRESKTTKRTARKEGTAYSKGVLLAPNGKPSNLNAMQHAQVRTPEFKKWFGDWENDPENASKVVDENGEPLVVYHVTGRSFNTFSNAKLGSNTRAPSASEGHFFSDNPEVAAQYANTPREDKLNGEENAELYPFDTVFTATKDGYEFTSNYSEIEPDGRMFYSNETFHLSTFKYNGTGVSTVLTINYSDSYRDDPSISYEISSLSEASLIQKINKDKGIVAGVLRLKGYAPNTMPVYLNIKNPGTYDYKGGDRDIQYSELLPYFKQQMFDGGVFKNTFDSGRKRIISNIFVSFNPNQIKSATGNTGAFSAENDDIRYSIKPTKDAQNIGKALVDLGLVKTSDKSISGAIREAVSGFMTGDNIVKLRAGWIDESAALSRLLKPLDMFDPKGKMRGDFVLQSIGNLNNMLRNSRGYIDTAGDGTLMSVDDPRLDLHNNIKLIDGLGYKDNRKTFFTALRVVAGKEILRIDVERRADAKLYKDFAGVLQKDIDHLTGALVDARRALAAAVTAKDAVQIKDFKSVISIITKEKAALTTRTTQLKEASNKLYAKHGTKSAVDIQADIDAKVTKAEKKEALAATTTDKTKRDALLDQVERLRDDADRLTKTLEVGVGTEQRVTPEDIALTEALLIEDPRLGEIMNNIFERLRKDVDLFEKAGIINSTTANDWRANPAYIPLYKSIDDLSDDPSKYVEVLSLGAKHSWEVKSREGSKQTVNVAENLVKHSALMAGAAAQNIARQTAAMQLNAVADTLFYETKDRSDPQATKFKVNGEDVYYHIGDTLAFEAFQTMIPLQPGWMRKVAKAHANVFRKVTLTTPVYWYRQLIRDPLMANLVAQSGLITPLHALYHMGKIVAHRSEGYNELQRRGITGAVDTLTDTTQLVKSIATKRGISGWLRDFVVHVHEASDAGTRVAVYEKALKMAAKRGIVDPQQRKNFAAMQAKEIINFSKKGKSRNHAAMRDSVPFFASTLNGMDTLARAAIPGGYGNLNVKDAATVRKHFYANAAMVTTASILYALQMDDDEDYRKSTDWITSWLIPTGNKDTPFIKIPIHFEAGFLFKVIPEILVRVSRGSLTPKGGRKALWEAFKALSVPPILPQIVKPVGEVITNHDLYTGNSITSFTESRLPLNQRTAHATPLAEKIAGGLPSFLNMSPNDIEHLGKGWFTEAWALSALLADAYISSVTGVSAPTKELGEKFLWKGVVTAPDTDANLSKFYEMSKLAEQLVNGIRAYKQVGDKEEAKALRDEPENAKLRKMVPLLGATGEQIGVLQKRIARIKNKPDAEMSPDEKAKSIREIKQRINILADRAVKRADDKGVSR